MVPERCAPRGPQHASRCSRWSRTATWRCWLAAELAARGRCSRGCTLSRAPRSRRTRPSAARRWCSWCSTSSRPTTCCGPTAASTPSGSRTSRGWRRSPPGSRTRPPCSTRPSARCRRSSTAACRGRGWPRTCAATSRASSTCWTGSDTRCSRWSRRSAVCPPSICPGARTRRPGVLARLAGGGRPARFHKWVGAIRKRPQPAFYFHHALMPHEPWLYLPSGHQSRPAGEDPIPDLNHDVRVRRPDLTEQNHLRHLLQVGYTDRLVGRAARPAASGPGCSSARCWSSTADHGYSFRVGVKSRRLISEDERRGDRAGAAVREGAGADGGAREPTASCATSTWSRPSPTCSAREVFYEQDGRSAFSREARAREGIEVRTRDFAGVVRIGLPELSERRAARRREHAELFGTGEESELLYGDPWASAYRVGPHPELLGRPCAGCARVRRAARPARATVANRALFEHVSPRAQVLPTRVTGSLLGVPPGEHRDLAVAVNGRIRATSAELRLPPRRARVLLVRAAGDGPAPGPQPACRDASGGCPLGAAGCARGSGPPRSSPASCARRSGSRSSACGRRTGCRCGSSRRTTCPCRRPRGCGGARRSRCSCTYAYSFLAARSFASVSATTSGPRGQPGRGHADDRRHAGARCRSGP